MEPTKQIPQPYTRNKRSRFFEKAAWLALIVAALGVGVFLRMSFQSSKVLKVNNSPFPTRAIHSDGGSQHVIVFKIDYCKQQDIHGKIRTSYVSATREVFLPLSDETMPKGCAVKEIPVLVPKDIVPDTYTVKFKVTYDLNPIKEDVVVEFETQPVQIQ